MKTVDKQALEELKSIHEEEKFREWILRRKLIPCDFEVIPADPWAPRNRRLMVISADLTTLLIAGTSYKDVGTRLLKYGLKIRPKLVLDYGNVIENDVRDTLSSCKKYREIAHDLGYTDWSEFESAFGKKDRRVERWRIYRSRLKAYGFTTEEEAEEFLEHVKLLRTEKSSSENCSTHSQAIQV